MIILNSSCVHISVEGCTKIRDEIVTFFDLDKVISVELKTPHKRTNSALSSTPNSVERQNKQTLQETVLFCNNVMIYCQEYGIVTGCKQIVEVVRLSNQAIKKTN